MGSILDIGNNKSKCQKFTPETIVEKMLDIADYSNNIVGKKVLENSFGSGNIITAIVIRYINFCLSKGYSLGEISKNLGKDIYGVELDKDLFNQCLEKLNGILIQHNIPLVKWRLYNKNFLEMSFNERFDYIIGNPPYISYLELDKKSREYIRNHFDTCKKGKFDYCYAFLESSINYLSPIGIMVQLVPNNIFKNVFANDLRITLSDHIKDIFDYPNNKLFAHTLTSTSIFLYDNNYNKKELKYHNTTHNTNCILDKNDLNGKWQFISRTSINHNERIRFGDVFNASVSIATLSNDVFIMSPEEVKNNNIESKIVRKAVSPNTLRMKKKKMIVFPYRYYKGKLKKYTEADFINRFPNTATYLYRNITKLESRDKDKSAKWFEYGRSQALGHLYQPKLLVSTIITKKAEIYRLDEKTIPFSGIYITVKDPNYSLDEAYNILSSTDFFEYINSMGINVNGNSFRISCNDINNYCFIRS